MLDLNCVMFNSEDPAKLAAFWTSILGEPGFSDSAYTGWKVGASYLMVGPHSEVKGTNEMPGRILINFETPDVHGEFARIRDAGAAVVQEPYQPSVEQAADMWLATLADVDGNYFQLASPMPEM